MSLEAKLKGKRLGNVYDIDKRNYLFKFGGGEEKMMLQLEIGTRLHLAVGEIDKKVVPSGLTMKMRKLLKSKRVERIKQIGVERVIQMTFGSGPVETHLFLEFYSKGNMVLTDKELVAITVSRSYSFNENARVAVGEVYPLSEAAKLTLDDLQFDEDSVKKLKSSNKTEPRAADLYF